MADRPTDEPIPFRPRRVQRPSGPPAGQEPYAPLATDGPVVEALRAKLAGIAEGLGHPPQIEQRVEIGTIGFHRAVLLPGVTIVRLVSPTFRATGDERLLGVAIGGIQLDGQVVPFTDLRLQQGFHDIEQNRKLRWTNGDAFIVLEPLRHERVLRVRVMSAAPNDPAP